MPEHPDLWSDFLDFLSQVITPNWNDLIPLIPLALTGLLVLFFLNLAFQWRRAAAINRPRVARPLRDMEPPPGVHLPGPSRWPFVVPIGAALLLFGLALPTRAPDGALVTPFNMPLLGVGLLVTAVGVIGWLRDAMREWRATAVAEAPSAAARMVAEQALTGGATALVPVRRPPDEPPPGVHLPGPSPWPFFAPIGMTVIFFGLVFHPALLLGGLLMSLIAVVGWLRDAGSEYRQTEDGHAPEPATRDPERAFPKRLVGVYGVIAALSLLAVVGPGIVGVATGKPGAAPASPAAGGGGAPSGDISIAAQNIAFDKQELTVPAGQPFRITFENREPAPHNVAIFEQGGSLTNGLFIGDVFPGPATRTYDVPALAAGSYTFVCTVHPNMKGTVTAQ